MTQETTKQPTKFDVVRQWTSDVDSAKLMSDIQLKMLLRKNPELGVEYIIDHVYQCQMSGANPALGEVFLVSHYDKRLGHKVGTTIYSIHYMIRKAREIYGSTFSNLQAVYGHEEVFNPITKEFELDAYAEASTFINGLKVTAKVYWSEFGGTSPLQRKMPRHMLCKCAKAVLLRDNFPMMADMYIREEMEYVFSEQPKDLSESPALLRQEAKDQLSPEEKEEGGELYRIPAGKFRGKQLRDISTEDLGARLDFLEKKASKPNDNGEPQGLSEDYAEEKRSIEKYLERIES